MKVRILLLFLFITTVSFSFLGFGENKRDVLKVGVTPIPQGEILDFVKKTFTEEDFDIDIIEYTDYNQPNYDLDEGKIDVNYFQHRDFLNVFNAENRSDLKSEGKIHFEKMGIYSSTLKNIKEIKGRIAIPNDESNKVRALKLLESTGLIKLDSRYNIVSNPRNIEIVEIDPTYLYRIKDKVDAIVVNANFMLENGYNPTSDSIYLEKYNSDYVNILVYRKKGKNFKHIKRLEELLKSSEVRNFVKNKYKGSVVIVD